jgi:hypothetical protein
MHCNCLHFQTLRDSPLSYCRTYVAQLILIDMRLYTALQARLGKVADITQYTFNVESSCIDAMDEWIVAAVTFPEGQHEQPLIIATIVLYKLMGASAVDLQCKVDDKAKEISIIFVQKPLEGDLNPDENAGDVNLSELVNSITSQFNRRRYEKDSRDIFQLVQTLNWRSEMAQLDKERSSLKGPSLVKIGIAVAAAAAAVWGLWKALQK